MFALSNQELCCTDIATHSIDTGGANPIRQSFRRIPFALHSKVEEMVTAILDQGVIQPSHSPCASPIVLVSKKDGSTRFCVDYRRLNAATIMDVYPLPRIDECLDWLANNSWFSALDLASGYWQVQMESSSREKTAFTTHVSLFELRVMPFGLCNAPATFQRLMECVLAGLVGNCCLVYIDDILVMGSTVEEHRENLLQVLDRLRQAWLCLKPNKCTFFQKQVEYLGYIVSGAGISTDPSKVQAVQDFPVPSDLKTLRSFFGLTSYYRRFMPNYSALANPLYALTRKDITFECSDECQQAFDRLKESLPHAPILAFPDSTQDFHVEIDASDAGLGAILAQSGSSGGRRPIAFASHTLQAHERNYGSTELDVLGVVWAVKHFRQYLYGHRCHVYTDHEALKALLDTPHPSGKLARWGLILQELDLTIHYQPGRKNQRADALSRYPTGCQSVIEESFVVVATTSIESGNVATGQGGESSCQPRTLEDRQRADPTLREFICYQEEGILPGEEQRAYPLVINKANYTMVDKVLYRVTSDHSLCIVTPNGDRHNLFQEAHEGTFGGHLGAASVWHPRETLLVAKDVGRHFLMVPSLHCVCHPSRGLSCETSLGPHSSGWAI